MMFAYGKRKAAGIQKQVMIASAITASFVAVLLLYHTLSKTHGVVSGLLNKVHIKIKSLQEESDDNATMEDGPTVFEEDAGDSYEI